MSIDWFTFSAQIINFLVLVWLLKRFLYGPIIRAMDQREAKIASRVQEAEDARDASDRQAAGFRQKTEELEHTREQLLAEAGTEVEQWRDEHIRRARAEVDDARDDWFRSLAREQQSFKQELRRRAASHVQQISRHVLSELSTADLERQATNVFLDRLCQLEAGRKTEIADAIRTSKHNVFIESAFELPAADRDRITGIVREQLVAGIDIEFRVRPELICGIELQTAGYKVSWSVGESLESLEEEFARTLDEVISFESHASSESESGDTRRQAVGP